tara:strand:- start:45499 stop:46740 length:1242 start_codon:yes stop_codon:yes gene_type:complete
MIKQNPFSSNTFIKIWNLSFNKSNPTYSFNFIKELTFFKTSFIPLYINTGKNLTKGVSYTINETIKDFKNKVFFIYDVPDYFKINAQKLNDKLRLINIKQYPGYFINLEKHTNIKSYLENTFSKKSVQKLNRYKRRLELCFNINYKVYHGKIEKSEYDFIFDSFKKLLTKRFDDKKITNNNLNKEEWDFYYNVVYPLILEKKASLFVVYNDKTPIAIRLNYYSETIIFDAITVFDIDYNKFHIGKISIMKMLEWSFEKEYKIFDFSKGYYDYKESWSDLKYDFEYHLYYDSSAIISTLIAKSIAAFFKFKQYLREKKLNEKLHKITYRLKKASKETQIQVDEIQKDLSLLDKNMLEEIDIEINHTFLKKHVFDFLFLTSEHLNDLTIYQVKNEDENTFFIKGKKNNKLIVVNN